MDGLDDISLSIRSGLNNTSKIDYITVVSIEGNDTLPKFDQISKQKDEKDYVTVLKIGTDEQLSRTITEEVLVYRLPGEKLGFGLKFEGGTKSAEFVKRLFIQSCAVNSPASRVQSSWGALVEGDEILEIDSVPVNTMTRIDCVRCLKDSNVVIKLLIRHRFEGKEPDSNFDESRSRSVEDLPLVVSAEKKRTPPPPPPVPPRKVNRKSKDNIASIVIPPKNFGDCSGDLTVTKQNHEIVSCNMKNHRLQSPYSSFRKQRQSPEVIKRVRRLSDDINCPPDAEVYIDLFSQESAYSLSESDDTGSSISTVVDKHGSYPTTTNSSFAGSLPSTPTLVQRHIDLSDDFDFTNDNYLFSKLVTSQPNDEDDLSEDLVLEKDTFPKPLGLISNENGPLQPPTNFQDAPLSYGNEDVKIIKSELRINLDVSADRKIIYTSEPVNTNAPSPPPRMKLQNSLEKESKNNSGEDVVDGFELPRLVDFVPKSNKNSPVRERSPKPNSIEIVKQFLENEKSSFEYVATDDNDNHIKSFNMCTNVTNCWDEESEFYSLDWSPSSKLATIGEDEEEVLQDNDRLLTRNENPVVIVENTDTSDESCKKYVVQQDDDKRKKKGVEERTKQVSIFSARTAKIHPPSQGIDVDGIMDGPRQPPDGHEFPDQEKPVEQKMSIPEQAIEIPPPIKPRESWMSKYEPQANSVRDKIAIFSKPQATLTKKYVSTSSIPTDTSNVGKNRDGLKSNTSLLRNNSINESAPLTTKYRTTASITPEYKTQNSFDSVTFRKKHETPLSGLHGRSVSLLDISDNSNKLDRWSLLIEQRSLSKLKGLVIPEHEPETDGISQPFVDLPEIRSVVTPVIAEPAVKETPINRRHSSSVSNFQMRPSDTATIPKYSPAFKRRSFQIHASNNIVPIESPNNQNKKANVNFNNATGPIEEKINKKTPSLVKTRDFSNFTVNIIPSDPPKSLESITSPTRSDYSFEFNNISHLKSPSGDLKLLSNKEKNITTRPSSYVSDVVGSSEYESDADSALSSSQSSYISKNSPPASPIYIRNDSITDTEKKSFPSLQVETTNNYESLNRRLLKPQSLEAINRKNILASAKCRSGRDLKVGSPLIQRKFDDNEIDVENTKAMPNGTGESKPIAVERQFVKEKPPSEVKIESPKPKIENINVPKVILKDIKSILNEKPIEPHKRTFAGSGYYNPHYPIMRRASSVTDLRKNFEKVAPTPAKRNSINSLMNTVQVTQPQPIKRTSLPQITPFVTPAKVEEPSNIVQYSNSKSDHDKIIDDALKEFDETISKADVKIVNLKADVVGGSLGITLAGGVDYETKEITIHKIREGSPAFKDGRLQKGDKILAINGKYMIGLSHAQSLKLLKENVPEIIIIACKGSDNNGFVTSPKIYSRQMSFENAIKEAPIKKNDDTTDTVNTSNAFEVSIMKDATGLGFSIQGGKTSPQGDVPLVIKKVFMGESAEKSINLKPGDELLEINHVDVTSMSRMEAWNLMKRLPEQEVIVKVRR